MIFLHITLFALAGLAMWWLSGYDAQVTGENRAKDYARRAARCLATAILALILFRPNAVSVGYAFIPLVLIIPPSIGILWAGCIGALFAQGLHHMIESDDRRPFDPNENARNLDAVASLLKSGRHEEAAQLCETLKASGDANILVLETLLARAGVAHESSKIPKPLLEVRRLRAEGKFDGAETVLKSLLAENPSNRGRGADADAALRPGFGQLRQGGGGSPGAGKAAAYSGRLHRICAAFHPRMGARNARVGG